MFLELDTTDEHRKNELPLMCSVDALEFPRNSTDTQPPPATAATDPPAAGSPRPTLGNDHDRTDPSSKRDPLFRHPFNVQLI